MHDGVLFVILRVDLAVDSRHAFSESDHGVLIHRHVCVGFSTRLRSGDFGFYLLDDGIKAVHVGADQMVFDLNSLTGVNQLLQPDLFIIREIAILPLFQQLLDFGIHRVQLRDVLSQLFRYGVMSRLPRRYLQFLQRGSGRSCQRLEGVRPV